MGVAPKTWFLLALGLTTACQSRRPDPLPGFPRLMLWAWERPERFDYVDPRSAGVAFLARTVQWRDGQVVSRPRMQPLRVAPGTRLMAVVRLESEAPPLPPLDAVRDETRKAVTIRGVAALQIDFDAKSSERAWYRQLLEQLRRDLNPSVPLTMTALVSWCQRDNWIDTLPVADAVPMLFRLGAGEPSGVYRFRPGICQNSFGISTDELPADLPHGRRLFVFNPHPWDEDAYRGAVRLAEKWK